MASQSITRFGRVADISFRCLKKRHKKKTIRLWLLANIYLVLPIQEHERYEFIAYCRSYSNQTDWLDQVSEFEIRYRPDEAIQWYTRPSGFPSIMINTICRTQNPILISKIRYFLKHMDEQLTMLYLESLAWMPNFVIVYRGQRVSPKEFKRLVRNRGKEIFLTVPLSTTNSSEVAAVFSGCENCRISQSEKVISVIFKITIRTQTARSKPFAYTQEYSYGKDKKKILFSIGTVFSFEAMRKLGVNSYEISLIHDQNQEETEKEIMRTAIESCSHRKEITMKDFLTSMKVCITLSDDFHCRPLTSLLNENSNSLSDKDSILGANHDHLVIWLDRYINEYDAYNDLKHALCNAIYIAIDRPPKVDEINRAILFNNVFPLATDRLFAVTTIERCLELIEKYYHKKIFLVTSGTLGATLVPSLWNRCLPIENIYVFCTDMRSHIDWAFDYINNLLMFNSHNDLLSRVVYDIGMYYLQKGITSRDSDDHQRALFNFYIARKLVMRANFMFQPYFPFSLTNIKKSIIDEEARLPQDIIRSIHKSLSSG